MAIDINTLSNNEKGGLIAGIVTFILSLMPAYLSFGGFGGVSAWHSFATLGVLLTIVATAIIGVKAFAADNLPAEVPWSLIALATAALGALLLILRAVTVSVGPGWSGYLIFVSSIVLAVFAFLMFKESGEKMPKFGENKAA